MKSLVCKLRGHKWSDWESKGILALCYGGMRTCNFCRKLEFYKFIPNGKITKDGYNGYDKHYRYDSIYGPLYKIEKDV